MKIKYIVTVVLVLSSLSLHANEEGSKLSDANGEVTKAFEANAAGDIEKKVCQVIQKQIQSNLEHFDSTRSAPSVEHPDHQLIKKNIEEARKKIETVTVDVIVEGSASLTPILKQPSCNSYYQRTSGENWEEGLKKCIADSYKMNEGIAKKRMDIYVSELKKSSCKNNIKIAKSSFKVQPKQYDGTHKVFAWPHWNNRTNKSQDIQAWVLDRINFEMKNKSLSFYNYQYGMASLNLTSLRNQLADIVKVKGTDGTEIRRNHKGDLNAKGKAFCMDVVDAFFQGAKAAGFDLYGGSLVIKSDCQDDCETYAFGTPEYTKAVDAAAKSAMKYLMDNKKNINYGNDLLAEIKHINNYNDLNKRCGITVPASPGGSSQSKTGSGVMN
jgi:hypothetical protein